MWGKISVFCQVSKAKLIFLRRFSQFIKLGYIVGSLNAKGGEPSVKCM